MTTLSLPTTRLFLTSLINTLTAPVSTSEPTSTAAPINQYQHDRIPGPGPDQASNPLKYISTQKKALLATLHVVFPPPMVLLALDLLDRGCVVRIVETFPGECTKREKEKGLGIGEGQEKDNTLRSSQVDIHPLVAASGSSPISTPNPAQIPAQTPGINHYTKRVNQVYQVRSSQVPKSRFSTSASTRGARVYTVRLEAWNCSCAAFAFSCFPSSSSSNSTSTSTSIPFSGQPTPWNLESGPHDNASWSTPESNPNSSHQFGKEMEFKTRSEWEFGGLSLDGLEDGSSGGANGASVPVCKHLLACLLGERWDILKGYVKEREVGKEEMAGLASEG